MGEGDKAQWDWVTSIYSILKKLPSQKVSSAQKSLCLHVYPEFFFAQLRNSFLRRVLSRIQQIQFFSTYIHLKKKSLNEFILKANIIITEREKGKRCKRKEDAIEKRHEKEKMTGTVLFIISLAYWNNARPRSQAVITAGLKIGKFWYPHPMPPFLPP